MNRRVVLPDIIREHPIELRKGVDRIHIQCGEPAAAECTEVPFHLALGSAVPDGRMRFNDAEGIEDQRKLIIIEGTAVIHVDLIRDSIGGDRLFKNLLVVVGVIVVKDFTTNNQARMIIDDHDQVSAPGTAIFRDVRKIGCVCLPHTSEFRHLIGFPILDERISGGFQIVFLQEPLDCAYRDLGVDKTAVDEHLVDHHAVDAGKCVP